MAKPEKSKQMDRRYTKISTDDQDTDLTSSSTERLTKACLGAGCIDIFGLFVPFVQQLEQLDKPYSFSSTR